MEEKFKKLRMLLNDHLIKGGIFIDKIKWNKVWSCMDVLEDTQLAIDSYFEEYPKFISDRVRYLLLYGLLQGFFLQQDALNNLHLALFDEVIDWKKDYFSLYEIRELRNDAIGHPTSRGKDESFHFISRISLSKDSFNLTSYFPKAEKVEDRFKSRDINLIEIRDKQREAVGIILDKVIGLLEEKIRGHKMKFKGKKLMDIFEREDCGYYIEKLFEALYSNDEGKQKQAEIAFKRLMEILEGIKVEINKRYPFLEFKPGLKSVIDDIDYVFSKICKFLEEGKLYESKDAEIFIENFEKRFEELREMMKEIDDEFREVE